MNSSAAVNLTITVLAVITVAFGLLAYSLAMHGKEAGVFAGIAATGLGAIGSMLASTNTKPKEADAPIETHISNTTLDPVPVVTDGAEGGGK